MSSLLVNLSFCLCQATNSEKDNGKILSSTYLPVSSVAISLLRKYALEPVK